MSRIVTPSVSPVFTPLLCNHLIFYYKIRQTFWHNTCLEGHGHNSGPARTPPSARQSQRAECLIGLRRKPFDSGENHMGRLLRRNIWIEAGISLFLMLFFIYFYCHIDQWVSKPAFDRQPGFFPVRRHHPPHRHERAACGLLPPVRAPHARGQGRRRTP